MSLMDNAPTPDAPAGDPAPVADTAPVTDPAAAVTPEPDTFSREYVEELRREAAGYRTERNTYKEAFDGYSPEEQDFLLSFAKDLRNPDTASTAIERMGEALGLTPAQAAAAQAQADADPDFDPFDPKSIAGLVEQQVQQVLSKRDAETQQQQSIDNVFKQVSELGMDPKGPDGLFLQTLALTAHNGDIAEAHKAVEAMRAADRQRYIDEYVAGKAGGADTAITPTPQTGGATEATEPPKTFEEARQRTAAILAARGARP